MKLIQNIIKSKYHIHLLIGYVIGHLLYTTYVGMDLGSKLFFQIFCLTVLGVFWEGVGKLIDKGNKFDWIDVASGVLGGLLVFLLPSKDFLAYGIYASVISIVINILAKNVYKSKK